MPNKITRFWQELKRRNVVRVITVYTGAAFVILSLVDMIREPFELPNWSFKLVVVLLSIGLIIAVILSWIYDVHPEGGLVKTAPSHKVKPEDIPKPSSGWKVASYISFVVIVGLIALNIFGGKQGPRIDESLAKSIAVLPFHNYSGDPGQDDMCEGLTDEIISNLFKLKSFDEVRSLTSVLLFKDSEKSTTEIAEALHVNYILEGSYKKMGNDLKVTAQLIEPKNDNHIWLQDYELPYNEVMGIPGDIALQIANNLRAFMTEGEQQSIIRIPTSNLEAYEIGNQINLLFKRWTSGEELNVFNQMIELCNRAIDLDPNYSEAYGYLGMVDLMRTAFSGDKEVLSVYWDAKQHMNKALELDSYNLMANYGHTLLNYWIDRDYVAIEEFKNAFPNALNNEYIAMTLPLLELQMGHYDEVLRKKEKGTPLDYLIKANILLGNYREARDQMKQMTASNNMVYAWYTFEDYIWLREFDSAMFYINSAPASGFDVNSRSYVPRFLADLAVALYKTGNEDQARGIIGSLIGASDTTAVRSPAFFTAWFYSWIGEPDSAFYWLEKAIKNRSIEIPWLKVDPAFNSLREDPRYRDIYKRTGFKAYDDYMASRKE